MEIFVYTDGACSNNGKPNAKAGITIVNSTGAVVRKVEVDNIANDFQLEIPVDDMIEGIYVVQVILNNSKMHLTKLIISK